LKREDERVALDVMLDYAFAGQAQKEGWGAMETAVWQSQIDTYSKLGQFTAKTPALADVIWTDGLKATSAARMKA
jgi:NitT/TauT family transport system substrate-binding protein